MRKVVSISVDSAIWQAFADKCSKGRRGYIISTLIAGYLNLTLPTLPKRGRPNKIQNKEV